MELLERILKNKQVTITNSNGNSYFGTVTEFTSHIDGGIILENGINLKTLKMFSRLKICKLCLPNLGQGNYKTTVKLVNNYIMLVHKSNNSSDVITDTIFINH